MSINQEPKNYDRALLFSAGLDSFKTKYFSNVQENINLETIANFSQEERLSFLGLDNDTDYSTFKLAYSKIEAQFYSLKKILEEEKFPADINKFLKLKELYLAVAEKIVLSKIKEQIRTFIEELPIQEKQRYVLYSYSSNSLLIENIGKVLRNQDVSLLHEDENFNKSVVDNLDAFTLIKEYLQRNNSNQQIIQSFDLRFLEPLNRVQQAFRQEEEKKTEQKRAPLKKINQILDLLEQKFALPSFDPRSFNIAFFDGENFVGSASDLIKIVLDQIDTTPFKNEVDRAKVATTLEKIAARILELNKKILTDLPVYQNLKRKIDGLNRDLAGLPAENLSTIKQHRSTLERLLASFEAAAQRKINDYSSDAEISESLRTLAEQMISTAQGLVEKLSQEVASKENLITREEVEVLQNWNKFFYHYGLHEDGTLFRETVKGSLIIRGAKESDSQQLKENIRKERHRAFTKWYITSWSNQTDFPNSFTKTHIFDLKLSEITEGLELISLTETGSGMDTAQSFLFGVTTLLNMGSKMFELQLDGKGTFEAYSSLELNKLDHLFKMGNLASGELTGTEYLQSAFQFLILHDPGKRNQYKRLLQGHLGETAFAAFEPRPGSGDKVLNVGENIDWFPRDQVPGATREASSEAIKLTKNNITVDSDGRILYSGLEIHKIMVQEAQISSEQKKLVIYQFALLILQQDRARVRKMISEGQTKEFIDQNGVLQRQQINEDNCELLNFSDAQFIAELILNTGSALGIFASQDNKDFVSQVFLTRLFDIGAYRSRKIFGKDLGPVVTVDFFKKFIPNGFIEFMIDKRGVTFEQLWMLAGVGENTGVGEEVDQDVYLERMREFYGFLPTNKNGLAGKANVEDIRSVNKTRVEDLSNFQFSHTIGKLYERIGGFVLPFYKYVTQSEKLIDNWLGGNVVKLSSSIKKFNNDVVGYYFGDMNIPAGKKSGETDVQFYERISEERYLFAQKGYVLVRAKKRNKEDPQFFESKVGGLTLDYKEAKETFLFTPFFDYFNILSESDYADIKKNYQRKLSSLSSSVQQEFERAYNSDLLVFFSKHDPAFLQEVLTEKIHPDVMGQMQDNFVQWILIGEMAGVREEFKKKGTEEKKKIITDIFSGLNQDVYNSIRFLNIGSRWRNDEVDLTGFGRFSFDDIYKMFERSGWISSLDVGINMYISELKRGSIRARKAGLKTAAQKNSERENKNLNRQPGRIANFLQSASNSVRGAFSGISFRRSLDSGQDIDLDIDPDDDDPEDV